MRTKMLSSRPRPWLAMPLVDDAVGLGILLTVAVVVVDVALILTAAPSDLAARAVAVEEPFFSAVAAVPSVSDAAAAEATEATDKAFWSEVDAGLEEEDAAGSFTSPGAAAASGGAALNRQISSDGWSSTRIKDRKSVAFSSGQSPAPAAGGSSAARSVLFGSLGAATSGAMATGSIGSCAKTSSNAPSSMLFSSCEITCVNVRPKTLQTNKSERVSSQSNSANEAIGTYLSWLSVQ